MMYDGSLERSALSRAERDDHQDLFRHLGSISLLLQSGLSSDELRVAVTAQLERLVTRLNDFFSLEEAEFFAPLLDEHPRLNRTLHRLFGQRFSCLARLHRIALRFQHYGGEAELASTREELMEVLSLFQGREEEKREVLALAYLEDLGGSE